MIGKTRFALSVMVVLGTISGTLSATRHHGHTARAVHGFVSTAARAANASILGNVNRGSNAPPASTDDTPGSKFQDEGVRLEIDDRRSALSGSSAFKTAYINQ
jgi:hypothetical protein